MCFYKLIKNNIVILSNEQLLFDKYTWNQENIK